MGNDDDDVVDMDEAVVDMDKEEEENEIKRAKEQALLYLSQHDNEDERQD